MIFRFKIKIFFLLLKLFNCEIESIRYFEKLQYLMASDLRLDVFFSNVNLNYMMEMSHKNTYYTVYLSNYNIMHLAQYRNYQKLRLHFKFLRILLETKISCVKHKRPDGLRSKVF